MSLMQIFSFAKQEVGQTISGVLHLWYHSYEQELFHL